MKKIYAFLLIMTMWHPAYGLDVYDHIMSYFTDDPKYTIDKRKYVSRDRAPFSAVVGLKYANGKNWCSGTLTADGIVVTAKHCIYGEGTGYKQLGDLYINHKDAGDVGVKHRTSSGVDIYAIGDNDNAYDWALLVPKKDIKSTIRVSPATNNKTADTVVAGYGALKILSDQEIRTIRTEYARWLNNMAGTNIASRLGEDLPARSGFGSQFVGAVKAGRISSVSRDTFYDTHRLKASYCQATASNKKQNTRGCQIWGGNSGGGVFVKQNDKWYLYGVMITGSANITNNRDTFAKAAHMVPINMFIEHYKKLVSKLKETTIKTKRIQ
ncbi:MAG: trypsin-like serine protease [Muribaculaceae bacterium]|nr:trypsin-like serine protease [Muribaculaceae bacterium]